MSVRESLIIPCPMLVIQKTRRMSRFYSEAYKWSLYEKYRSGFTLTELQEISGITDKPLREWFRCFDLQYSRASSTSLKEVNRKSNQLRKHLKAAQIELGLLQNEAILAEVPESVRISCAQPLLDRYGPNIVCRTLKIRKSNLYYHTLRRPEKTVYEKHNLELTPAIREICGDGLKRIGAEKIRQRLISQGFSVSKRKVLELLQEFSPWTASPQRKDECSTDWPCDCRNILARRFSQPRPNMAWFSDITAIRTDSGKYYLCVVLDLFARRVVAARLSETEDTTLISHTFQDAYYSRKPPKGLIFHSDQGGQYRSHEFRNLLLRHKVRQSFSAPGMPYDNAPMESFFASLKVEETYRFRYAGIRDLTASLRDYISFYNNKRLHTSNGGRAPAETELEYFQKHGAVEAIGCAL